MGLGTPRTLRKGWMGLSWTPPASGSRTETPILQWGTLQEAAEQWREGRRNRQADASSGGTTAIKHVTGPREILCARHWSCPLAFLCLPTCRETGLSLHEDPEQSGRLERTQTFSG